MKLVMNLAPKHHGPTTTNQPADGTIAGRLQVPVIGAVLADVFVKTLVGRSQRLGGGKGDRWVTMVGYR